MRIALLTILPQCFHVSFTAAIFWLPCSRLQTSLTSVYMFIVWNPNQINNAAVKIVTLLEIYACSQIQVL